MKIDKKDPFAWYARGLVSYYQEKDEEALEFFNKALEIDPLFMDALYDKGGALDNLERLEEAILCYDAILIFDPVNTDALYNKGVWLWES